MGTANLMKSIYDTLVAIRQDVVSTQLKPEVQQQLHLAIKHLLEVVPIIDGWRIMSSLHARAISSAQQGHFKDFKTPQGRFLGREIDCYPKCANG